MFIDKVTKLDEMREINLQKDCKPSENHIKRSNIIMDFAMIIDKLDLANIVVEVLDNIMDFQFFWLLKQPYKLLCPLVS